MNKKLRNQQFFPKKKSKKSKKQSYVIWLLLSICTVLLLFGVVYKIREDFYKSRLDNSLRQLLQQVQQNQTDNIPVTQIEHKKENVQFINFIPRKKLPIGTKDIEKKLTELTNNQRLSGTDEIVVIGQVQIKNVMNDLSKLDLFIQIYQLKQGENNFSLMSQIYDSPIFFNRSTNEEVPTDELISKEENFLGIHQLVQQKILDEEHDISDKFVESVLNLPRTNKGIIFTHKNIEVELPDNDTGKKTVSLSYKEIKPYINEKFSVNKHRQYEVLNNTKKYIALSFDDGPKAETTPLILDILASKNTKSTFFMLGQNVTDNVDILKRMKAEGHELASHTFHHFDLAQLSSQEVIDEIHQTDKAIFDACGVLPKIFRPPYGIANKKIAEEAGKPVIQWSIDSEDWKTQNTGMIINQVNTMAFEGGIILMHDIYPTTVNSIANIIDQLNNQGYEFVTVSELLSNREKPLHQYFSQMDEREID